MIEHHCTALVLAISGFSEQHACCTCVVDRGHGDLRIPDDARSLYFNAIADAASAIQSFDLEGPFLHIKRLLKDIQTGSPMTYAMMDREFATIIHLICYGLTERKFVYVPHGREEFFEHEKLFGEQVYVKFPSICRDAKDAGNCIAADISNAAVYELIRVAEGGLRILAHYCYVPKKEVPYEHLDWGKIISHIGDELKSLPAPVNGNIPAASTRRKETIEFCQKALLTADRIKTAWRHESAHNRTDYIVEEAMALLSDVKTFMQLLATRLSEERPKRIPRS